MGGYTHSVRVNKILLHVFVLFRCLKFVDCGSLRDVSPIVTTTGSDTVDDWKTIKHWPDGLIPYDLTDAMYDKSGRGLILSAMKRWEYKTCVKFVPWSEELLHDFGEERYIRFTSVGSCYSRTGVEENQPQLFGLGKRCLKMSTILHELGHTIGLVHEMERTDRDLYIDILYEHMNADSWRNFNTTDSKRIVYDLYNVPYDYKSIMHYGPKAWSRNKMTVLVTKDPAYQHVIGKADEVSFFDAQYVNRAYSCSEQCSDTLSGICQNGGFLGGPDCKCICQDGYAGEFCEAALPGFEHIIEWRCQKGWEFHDGKCYLFNTDEETVDFFQSNIACTQHNATLAMFKGRPELEWLNHRVQEQKLVRGMNTFWIGVYRDVDVPAIKWIDGTFVDTNLVSVVDYSSTEQRGCGEFDGETVTLQQCTPEQTNGYICEKDFDSTCGGRYLVSNSIPIIIQSPGFPNAYPEGVKCTYVLQTHTNARIKITFDSFKLNPNNRDYLDVLLDNDVTLTRDRYVSDSLNGTSLQSRGNLVIVTFKSDGRASATGFKATVIQIRTTPTVATTIPSLPFLDAIRNALSSLGEETDPNTESESWWSVSELFNIIRSMTFSKIL